MPGFEICNSKNYGDFVCGPNSLIIEVTCAGVLGPNSLIIEVTQVTHVEFGVLLSEGEP